MPEESITVLLELRPALDGHSGIPQETRLLFRGLARLQGVTAIGLIQSSNLIVDPGLPMSADGTTACSGPKASDLLSRAVVSLQQGPASHRFEALRRRLLLVAGPLLALLQSILGRSVRLTAFEPQRFGDFVWRAMFAKTLPSEDFAVVTMAKYRILRWPWSGLHRVGVATSWFGRALYARLDTRRIDVMISETPLPARVSRGTRLIVRYHDAIPVFMPHTIKSRGYHQAMHMRALERNAADGAWFACVSDTTRHDLVSILPDVADRAVTIPNMVSHHYFPNDEDPDRIGEIIWTYRNRQFPSSRPMPTFQDRSSCVEYLLIVCTIEPRKNHLTLVEAWSRLRVRHPELVLVVVGALGWEHEPIMARLEPWIDRGGVFLLADVPASELRLLYRHARATVCPSYGEGFDFPGVEAMRSGGVVVASDIAVHRDVFGQGCEYFDPYDVDDLEAVLERLLGPNSELRRQELIRAGDEVSRRYLPERVMPQWEELLKRVVLSK